VVKLWHATSRQTYSELKTAKLKRSWSVSSVSAQSGRKNFPRPGRTGQEAGKVTKPDNRGLRVKIRTLTWIGFIFLFLSAVAAVVAQSSPEEVAFPSGGRQLHGFLWKPEGRGPFRAILWNHGSEKLPGSQPSLAQFYTAHSFVFFLPHRRGQGRSPGDYIQDRIAQAPPADRARLMVELQEAEVDDVIAALNYLKSRSFVDPARIAISGCSYGGIQTLLAGERDLGIRALVPFAPGAMSWDQNQPLQDLLVRSVDVVKVPVFLVQAENDYSLSPSHVLSKEANRRHKDFQSKIYPAFGSGHRDGHWGFCSSATNVWGVDVLDFLDAKMKAP
jgi:carboxymethylenebutenolidase